MSPEADALASASPTAASRSSASSAADEKSPVDTFGPDDIEKLDAGDARPCSVAGQGR
jgi:hypothetical protein